MEHHTAPLGLVAKLLRWTQDFVAMPGRVRRLAEGVEEDRDKRPKCTSCGAGRVGELFRIPREHNYNGGTCDRCGRKFYVSVQGGAPGGLLPDEFHD